MKKIYALCSLLLICIGVFSQTEIIDKDLQLGASGVEYLGYGKSCSLEIFLITLTIYSSLEIILDLIKRILF